MRVCAAQDAALEAGVDGHDLGVGLVEALVDFLHRVEDGGSRIRRPAAVSAFETGLDPGKGENAPDPLGKRVLGAVHGTAEQARDDEVALVDLDHGQVVGGLDHAGHVVAHALPAVGAGQDGADELLRTLLADIEALFGIAALSGLADIGLEDDLELRVGRRILVLELSGDAGDGALGGGDFRSRDIYGRERFARNGVAQGAALQVDQLDPVAGQQGQEDARGQLVGVGPAEDDVHPGMSALAALDGQAPALVLGGLFLAAVAGACDGVQSAGAADVKFAFGLGVEVDQDVAFQDAGLEQAGAGHAGLLVIGDQHLDRAVLDFRGFQDGERHGDAQSVVGAERGALGLEPVTVHPGLDRVGLEIVDRVRVLLGDHVHVSLEDHALPVLETGRGGHPHDDVAGVVREGFHIMFLGPIQEIGADLFFVFGRTRLARDAVEIVPDNLRLQVVNGHIVWVLF